MRRDRSTQRANAIARAAQPVDMWTTAAQFPTYPQAQQQENARSSILRYGPRKPAILIVADGKNS